MLALVGGAGHASALGWNLTLNPGFSSSSTITTDETGHRSKSDFTGWTQRYRLTLDQQLWPLATLSAGGTFEQLNGTSHADGTRTDFETQTWNGFASLRVGARPVSGGLDYTRREQAADLTGSTTGSLSAPTLVRESFGGTLSLSPADLPSLDVQVTRTDTYDRARAVQDRTADSLNAASRWSPVRKLDVSYGLVLGRDEDHKTQVETTGVANSLSLRHGDSYLNGRVSSYLSYQAGTRSTTVRARGPGGRVQVPQPVALGHSKVETFADRPAKVTLNPNADLTDGNTSARAGLNLGWGASAAGDRANRDIGAQFPNLVTPVNVVHVYVDRTIPASVAATLSWSAWRTDDNQLGDWTPVNTGTVSFDPLTNRFEISIDRTEARFVKVVAAPLAVGVSTDPALAEINVTEIQFFLEESATEAQRRASLTFSESVNTTLRVSLVPKLNLSYDFSGMLTHTIDPTRYTWTVTNGVGLSNRLSPAVAYSARVSRADSDAGQGHLAQNQWTASLALDPLQTLGGSLSYSGQVTQDRTGSSLSNALAATARAELYQGIAAGANGSYALSQSPTSRLAENGTASGSLSLVPNRFLSTSGSIGFTWSRQRAGGLPTVTDRAAVAEGGATLSPFQALALTGSIRRTWLGQVASTSGSFSAAASILRGGALQARYNYVTSFETAARLRTTTHGPGVRWNIRTGWYVDGGANWTATSAPAQSLETEAYFANLVINLK